MAKQYKVLKGWPGITVGAMFTYDHEDKKLLREDDSYVLVGPDPDNLDNLIRDGWITEVEELNRWRALAGGAYWSIGINPEWQSADKPEHVQIYKTEDEGDGWDHDNYKGRNYFRSEKTAEKVAVSTRLMFDWLHKPVEVTSLPEDTTWTDMQGALDVARAAVLEDNQVKS